MSQIRFRSPRFFCSSRVGLRCCATVFLFLCLLFIAMNLLKQSHDKVTGKTSHEKMTYPYLQDMQEKQIDTRAGEGKKRQNLIIVAHGRSGSTFTGNIFNHHPSVLYLFEPYQTVERLHGGVAPHDKSYQEKGFEWMKAALQCDFVSAEHAKDLHSYYTRKFDPSSSNPVKSVSLLSPPFCAYNTTDERWSVESCPIFDQKTLEAICEKKYNMTVAKVLIGRMPGTSVQQLLWACDSGGKADCKVIFLVRDPRGIIPSSQAVGFFGNKDKVGLEGTRAFANKICSQTELNLDYIRTLPPRWKKRVKLLRYEDLAANPLEALPGLLEFAGLPTADSLTKWLYQASHLPETESERRAQRWRQDSSEGVHRWRWLVHPYKISIIEHYCKHVMKLLGYRRVDQSYEAQRNLTVRLLENDYEALRWFEVNS